MNPGRLLLIFVSACAVFARTVQVVKVESGTLDRSIKLSGEIPPFQCVGLRARVPGFVEKVLVDRGSLVRQGDSLVSLTAPEMEARAGEAEAKVRACESAVAEAKAKVVAAESTCNRLKEAAASASECPSGWRPSPLALSRRLSPASRIPASG